jgi:hypothetical protein
MLIGLSLLHIVDFKPFEMKTKKKTFFGNVTSALLFTHFKPFQIKTANRQSFEKC